MKRLIGITLAVALLVGLIAASLFLLRDGEREVQARLIAAEEDIGGFARADGPIPLAFPADHGPHPDYQTEWWYFTGNMEAEDGRRFGYQLTFFRRALIPAEGRVERESGWAADQVYMAHFTVTDVAADDHHAFERLSRGAAGLAGAQAAPPAEPFRVWLEDWSVEETADGLWHARAAQGGIAIDLLLDDRKGPVLQGDRGYSQKGPEPGNASYYYSLTRLATTGTVSVPGGSFEVTGWSWMDHEFSTSALSAGQIGWDWFSIQLDDDTELMLYYVRRDDGSVDPLSKGLFVGADGTTRLLRYADGDFTIAPGRTWRSAESGGVYPVAWAIEVPALGLTMQIEALVDDQENRLSYAYWEGAVRIEGEREGRPVAGYGYVEMTGYAASMEGQF